MKKLALYPTVVVMGQDYSKEKIITVPDQSMSIRQILVRYVRRQALPQYHDSGIYAEGLGDLEKMSREDIAIQHDRIADLKSKVSKADKHIKARQARPAPVVESPSVGAPPKGDVTGSPVVGQAPPAVTPQA